MENNGTYSLSIFERLRLVNDFLPKAQGSFLTLKLANETVLKLGLTQEEINEYELKGTKDGKLQFNVEKMIVNGKAIEKEFEIPKAVVESIQELLKEKDRQQSLGFETYSIYEKFIESKEEVKEGN